MQMLVKKVVSYWSGFLKDPSTSRFNNGDDSKNGVMSSMLSEMGKPKSYPLDEINEFETKLTKAIELNKPSTISVDYSPDSLLGDIANSCLSNWNNMSTFPCKTTMWINYDTGEVSVSEGYGANETYINEDGTKNLSTLH